MMMIWAAKHKPVDPQPSPTPTIRNPRKQQDVVRGRGIANYYLLSCASG